LALGASRRKVVLWDFQKAVVEQVLEGFNHSIGEVAYTRQGVLLAGERTVNDETSCAVYACRDGKPYPALSKVNSITAIEPVGETQALVALRNFSVALLELADAPKRIGSARFKFWPRSACVSLNQQYAALVHHGVTIVNLPSLEIAAQSTAWQRVAHCAAFLPDGRGIAVGMYNGDVVLLREKRLRVEKSSLVRHTGWVEGLATLNKHSYLISAGADGVIQLTDWNERRVAFTGGEIGAPITSLHISPDENFMAIGYSDASLSLWDLRAADLPGILEQPFAQATHLQLAALNALAESGKLALQPPEQMALQFARLALQFRFRFDIELELPPEIKAGEYDIEIE
jgi:WD40 repeat protein